MANICIFLLIICLSSSGAQSNNSRIGRAAQNDEDWDYGIFDALFDLFGFGSSEEDSYTNTNLTSNSNFGEQ